ncbi:hypothetical protein M2404_002169 [Rheinheimera pacifica]|uniref:hypothetical protein n=1 Tax=Rheinheimera pacifica TaxID=173990 RepID=UPI00216A2A6C|nr:hypothetical protein [Rheinheimera pacifica]MCS4307821.1 hypothetical protein [Rheinheimera pacifica]
MSKALIIIGCLVLLYAIAAFAVDLLPVNGFQSSSDDTYLKVVPTAENSFDWTQFRLPALVFGAVLVVIGMFVGGKN